MNGDTSLPAQTDAQPVKPPSPVERQERLAAWLQFPRRVVLLLIAFVMALSGLAALRGPLLATLKPGQSLNWSLSFTTRRPVAVEVGERLPNTLLLLGAALFLAALLALMAILVAVLIHKLEEKAGPPGSILKGLGRLVVFGQATMPAFGLAVFLILIFAIQLKWLPAVGMFSPSKPGDLGDRISHLILPALALAIFPAALTAQAVTRQVTLPRERPGVRLWLAGLFKGLGVLLGQIGGLISAAVLVETVFAWPGVGRAAADAAMRRDYPLLVGVLGSCAGLILAGRLAAELFRWLERLMRLPTSIQLEPSSWRKTARVIWVVVALALLLAPLALAIAGLTVNSVAATKIDSRAIGQPPSASHPWGTDQLGRDLQARVFRGGVITLGVVVLAAVIILLPSLLGGALTSFLASRRVWWAESLADLLLLPADALLFLPAVLGGIVMVMLLGPSAGVGLAVAVVLLPRAVRVYQTLWTAAPERRKIWVTGLAGSGGLLLGTLFAGFGLGIALEYLGFGVQPPQPTLGGMLAEALRYLTARQAMALAPGIAIWVCALSFYTAADALVGFFYSKEALARLNE